MCGRYILTTPTEALKRLFDFIEQPNLAPHYNIAPTQDAPVLRQRREPAGERTLQNLRWGLIPSWAETLQIGSRLINARAETLLERPAFRTAFRRRRCLVPANGFYEWRSEGAAKQPYLISRGDGAAFAFAGLWERWTATPAENTTASPIDSFTIITTSANDLLRPLHARMPVILPPEAFSRWLDPDADAATLTDLLVPAPNEGLSYAPVDQRVNAARHDDAGLITPIGPAIHWDR